MTFQEAVELILKYEGGLTRDLRDPGGTTNLGIAQKYYPDLDIVNLTKEQAIAIYKKDYWDKCRCDELPDSLRLAVFDCSVNQGISSAIKLLQGAVGLKPDGLIGPETLKYVHAAPESTLLKSYLALRRLRYQNTKNFEVFGKGWLARLDDVTKKSGVA